MKVEREFVFLKTAALLFAGLTFLTLPMAAQQEVNPEHFDAKPSPARSHKPAVTAHKTAVKNRQSATNQGSTAPKDKNKVQAPSVLKADATTSQHSR